MNKMDNTEPKWDKDRYDSICVQVRALLESLQFPAASIQCVPVSGITGANVLTGTPAAQKVKKSTLAPVVNMSEVCPWYSGASLMEMIDSLPLADSLVLSSSSLRAVVTSVSDNHKGCDVTVKILRGRLKVGQTVGYLGGTGGVATAKFIRSGKDGRTLNELHVREQGEITLVDR